MRLYRVESFYAFLLYFRSEGSKEKGQPGMARLSAKGASHGQPPLQGRPPAGAVAPASARKGQPTTAGLKGGRPMVGWLPSAKGSHHLRRATTAAQMGQEESPLGVYRRLSSHVLRVSRDLLGK
ncbi:hypothetical protein B296_00052241 [Ensete ventricosum]|uniref:Uncharacterized protein n=1 Tax=Ensete ventricosum TaxID=4639 RepID=A0A426X2D7_ENSVE|nr:hypothetical protein B296_00052241 [Ensete ventricosum]